MSGINGTIMAYGQTSSGKTYTMSGGSSPETYGVVPRVVGQLFSAIDTAMAECDLSVQLTFLVQVGTYVYVCIKRVFMQVLFVRDVIISWNLFVFRSLTWRSTTKKCSTCWVRLQWRSLCAKRGRASSRFQSANSACCV
jgi:hypothetical protein